MQQNLKQIASNALIKLQLLVPWFLVACLGLRCHSLRSLQFFSPSFPPLRKPLSPPAELGPPLVRVPNRGVATARYLCEIFWRGGSDYLHR